jgi:hypothetical protein
MSKRLWLLSLLLPCALPTLARAAHLVPCSAITDGAVTLYAGDTAIQAAFTPNFDFSLPGAAAACGFVGFDWQQIITTLPDPSPFRQGDGTRLTSASTPFFDPAPGGYTYCFVLSGYSCDSYPFYWNPNTTNTPWSLNEYEDGNTLFFYDSPADSCLPGGRGVGCLGLTAPAGSFLGFTTQLVGILPDGSAYPLPDFWTWTDTFNGTSGGISTTANFLPVDAGSGTGGITITSETGVDVSTPEPSSVALVCLGACLVFARLRVARRKALVQCL